MFGVRKQKVSYINAEDPTASTLLARKLQDCMRRVSFHWDELVFLCIGSDRITGDRGTGIFLCTVRWTIRYML